MINILGEIPHEVILSCSGGVDSMAVLDFLIQGGRSVTVLNFNHGTDYGRTTSHKLQTYCESKNINFMLIDISSEYEYDSKISKEANWHNKRYQHFTALSKDTNIPIITCHHLDDQVENWIMTSLVGDPFLIQYRNSKAGVIRPFLLTRKSDFYSWCNRKDIPYWEDPSNADTRYRRNLVRKEVLPAALRVNPGIHKTIAKKIQQEYNEKVTKVIRDCSSTG